MANGSRGGAVANGTAGTASSGTSTRSPQHECTQARLKCYQQLGFVMSLPGIVLTCIGFTSENGIERIVGPCLLGLGVALMYGSIFKSLFQDWEKNESGHPNWNDRIRSDSQSLCWIGIIAGLPLACTGFSHYPCHEPSILAIVGVSVIGFGELLLLCGLSFGKRWAKQRDTVSRNNAPDLLGLRAEFEAIGWALVVPGIGLSCVGWIKENECLIPGIIGATSLTIGGSLLITITLRLWHSASAASEKTAALGRLNWLCFLCGIIMTPVGFTHRPYGLALGVAGACCLGLSVLLNVYTKCIQTVSTSSPPNVTTSGPGNTQNNVQQSGSTTNTPNDTHDLPNYADSILMPTPEFGALSSEELYGMYQNRAFAPPAGDQPASNQEDEPPPPSYDEVVKGMAGVNTTEP